MLYGITPAELGFLKGTGAGVWHMHDYTGLRERAGCARSTCRRPPKGSSPFPSFHTVVAILCGWSLLKTRWVIRPYAAYAGLVVFTTLPLGGEN